MGKIIDFVERKACQEIAQAEHEDQIISDHEKQVATNAVVALLATHLNDIVTNHVLTVDDIVDLLDDLAVEIEIAGMEVEFDE
tara:strand:+ start:897 stop:1145 length:249 start_codon:yes stop_codon:yes gene_type:complete